MINMICILQLATSPDVFSYLTTMCLVFSQQCLFSFRFDMPASTCQKKASVVVSSHHPQRVFQSPSAKPGMHHRDSRPVHLWPAGSSGYMHVGGKIGVNKCGASSSWVVVSSLLSSCSRWPFSEITTQNSSCSS